MLKLIPMNWPPLPYAELEQLKHVSSFNQDQFYDMKVYSDFIKNRASQGDPTGGKTYTFASKLNFPPQYADLQTVHWLL
ncbi:hypothetical protein E2C01_099847 [Portunus trituberculatus]|uniref:Uncharacterized protein n=1 Tax=Portunus trituberculatus TaxID=210409 RepID=A0A5B7K6K1_PORTR|nr:hypothetical protein [Portunus trituberculatus]